MQGVEEQGDRIGMSLFSSGCCHASVPHNGTSVLDIGTPASALNCNYSQLQLLSTATTHVNAQHGCQQLLVTAVELDSPHGPGTHNELHSSFITHSLSDLTCHYQPRTTPASGQPPAAAETLSRQHSPPRNSPESPP